MPNLSCSLHMIWREFTPVANLRVVTLKSGGPNPEWGHFSECVSRMLFGLVLGPESPISKKQNKSPPFAFFGRARSVVEESFKSVIPF